MNKLSSISKKFTIRNAKLRILKNTLNTTIPIKTECIETKRKRLIYQSKKRGISETCIILSNFAKNNIHLMSSKELDEYDILLKETDWDIFYWIIGSIKIPKKWENSNVLKMLVTTTIKN